VALRFALEHRDRVRALVLIRPAWFDRPHPPSLAAFASVARLLREHEPERARAIFAASAEYARVRAASAVAADSLLSQFSRPGATARAAVLERMPADAPLPVRPSWHELDMPTLVLGTPDDPLHPLTYADALAKALPNAHLQNVTPKAVDEHAHRREVAAAIDVFLEGLPAPALSRHRGPRGPS
jgi:pimeloyl-ACP methyl ester carboxylesterase